MRTNDTASSSEHPRTTGAEPSPDAARARFVEILRDLGTVILMTRGEDGDLVGRPMALAHVDDDGTIYFATGVDTEKAREIRTNGRVAITGQSRTAYLAMRGDARVSQDRAKIDELWEESWKIWFPQGKDDPAICLVIVTPDVGEYWDQKAAKGLSYLFRAAKAYVTGHAIEVKDDDNVEVAFH